MKPFFFAFLIVFMSLTAGLWAQPGSNPALPGFDAKGSDARAVQIADQVMAALGGRTNWDNTRHITWNFFGRRTHVWDKWSGNYRLEADTLLVLMNLNSHSGRAWIKGAEVSDAEKLATILKRANSIWINDSYWLLMPYKLKDSGVTLKYLGEKPDETGQTCEVLQMTFTNVGDTPQNKYQVYVNPENHRVVQWAFFSDAGDAEPRFTTPWGKWTQHGKIMLSGDRGEKRQITNIAVFEQLPAKVYESPETVDVMQYKIGMMD